MRELVELLGVEVRRFIDDIGQQAAAGERDERNAGDCVGKCAGARARECVEARREMPADRRCECECERPNMLGICS